MNEPEAELTREQIRELESQLRQRLQEAQRDWSVARGEARPVGLDSPIGRLTRMDALAQQHMASARRGRIETELAQIRQALAKIAAGTYGECVRCEEPITLARLSARPESPFCVRCQERSGG